MPAVARLLAAYLLVGCPLKNPELNSCFKEQNYAVIETSIRRAKWFCWLQASTVQMPARIGLL
jgi:hypothetical protein